MPFEPPFPGAVLVETHAHTAEVSACCMLRAKETVRAAAERGYAAVVITDHNVPGRTRTAKQCASFARGYELARRAGERLGVAVLPGMELRFDSQGYNDFLVYLPDPALCGLRGLPAMGPRAFKRLADERGMLVYQAHPFRPYLFVEPPEVLHGVEVHNGNPRHTNRNALALAYAQAHGLAMLSGSDIHQQGDAGHGGIWTPKEAIASPAAFVEYLRATPCPAMLITDNEI
ncbi:MAG: PHP domain-containing protein [Clostridia bacterium]|nr:PHP domain-containing protein [Clostridia bacterium]